MLGKRCPGGVRPFRGLIVQPVHWRWYAGVSNTCNQDEANSFLFKQTCKIKGVGQGQAQHPSGKHRSARIQASTMTRTSLRCFLFCLWLSDCCHQGNCNLEGKWQHSLFWSRTGVGYSFQECWEPLLRKRQVFPSTQGHGQTFWWSWYLACISNPPLCWDNCQLHSLGLSQLW